MLSSLNSYYILSLGFTGCHISSWSRFLVTNFFCFANDFPACCFALGFLTFYLWLSSSYSHMFQNQILSPKWLELLEPYDMISLYTATYGMKKEWPVVLRFRSAIISLIYCTYVNEVNLRRFRCCMAVLLWTRVNSVDPQAKGMTTLAATNLVGVYTS